MRLLEKIQIGNMTLKNRIMFPPLTTGYEERDGSIGEQSFHFYKRLAQGGVGYIVIGDVAPVNTASPTPKLYDDNQIPAYRRLADALHEFDCKLGLQVFHPEYDVPGVGKLIMESRKASIEGQQAKEKGDMAAFEEKMAEAKLKSNEAYAKLHHDMQCFVNEASVEQLEQIKDYIAQCARRSAEAGVDAIEIHGDRLLGSLCSVLLNQRTDKYGGEFENRIRYALEVVAAIKEAAPGMAVEYKLPIITKNPDGSNRGKGGLFEEEGILFAKKLEEAGVNMLQVAQANHTGNMGDTIPPMGSVPYGWILPVAEKVKKAVGIPVAAVGRVITAKNAEALIETNKVDIVGLGRSLLCDPDFVKKIEEGRADEIRFCLSCNKGCTDNIQNRKFLSCVLNAENGYEYQREITPAEKKKKVVVVGGGPAGLEAARVARIKGHDVVLFEKETKLGGQLNIASVPPRKYEMTRAVNYLAYMAKKLGVELRLGREVCAHCVLEENPDAVIVAVGASPVAPPIPGNDMAHVLDAWKVLSHEEICSGKVTVIGGGLVGCETAEFLAEQGCKVTIVEMLDEIAAQESATVKPVLMAAFQKHGVALMPKTTVKEITASAVECVCGEENVSIQSDFVVLAVGAKPNRFDSTILSEKGIEVKVAGGCDGRPSDINHAVEQGYLAANEL